MDPIPQKPIENNVDSLSPKSRMMPIIGSLLGLVVMYTLSIAVLSHAWGGCNGNPVGCSLSPRLDGWMSIVTVLFLIFSIEQAIAGAGRRFNLFFKVFCLIVALWFTSTTALNNGLVSSWTQGTELQCKLMGSTDRAMRCYTDLAKSKDDVSYCKYVDWSSDVVYKCRSYFALKDKDVSLCGDNNPYCVQDVAKASGRGDLCEAIANEYTKSQCYVIVAESTNDILLCQHVSTGGFPFCDNFSEKIRANPESYITAKTVGLEVSNLTSSAKAGQKDVSLIKIIATTPEGMAALTEFSFIMQGASIFDTFENLSMYKEDDGVLRHITGGAVFSAAKNRPSFANLANAPVIISNKPQTFILKGDVRPGIKIDTEFVIFEVKALGSTKVELKKFEGGKNIQITI